MNFDRVAGVYDRLAMCVFGKEWSKVQSVAATELNRVKKLLILGGGTGAILEELGHPEITYVEMSGRMIDQAKQRPTKSAVRFVNTDFLQWKSDQQFDAIYCPFFLDCFNEEMLLQVLQKISEQLKDNGILHVVDFQKGNWIQKTLVQMMLLFFKIASGLSANQLLDLRQKIVTSGYDEMKSKELQSGWVFYSHFCFSSIASKLQVK
ncbi:MAG: class I SAM-dependent methyltransferase [Marinoscillum sp.]